MKTEAMSKRERLLAILTAATIASVIIATLVIEPQIKRRKAYLAKLHEQQLQLTKMRRNLLLKNRVDQVYKEIEPLAAGTRGDQQEISAFTREVGDLYSGLSVRTRSVKLLPIVHEPYYRQLSLRIEMQGHVREILRFVRSVETHDKPIRIDELALKARETADQIEGAFLITKVVTDPGK